MTCEQCQNLRSRLRNWFLHFIGAASRSYAQMLLGLIQNESDRLSKGITALDEVTGKWLQELQSEVNELPARMTLLRELNKNVKEMVRKQDDRIRDLENEISQLTEAVGKIEFPDFEKIEYTIPQPGQE